MGFLNFTASLLPTSSNGPHGEPDSYEAVDTHADEKVVWDNHNDELEVAVEAAHKVTGMPRAVKYAERDAVSRYQHQTHKKICKHTYFLHKSMLNVHIRSNI